MLAVYGMEMGELNIERAYQKKKDYDFSPVRAMVLQGLRLRSAHQFDLIEFSLKKSPRHSVVE
jgi:hypothetical protein